MEIIKVIPRSDLIIAILSTTLSTIDTRLSNLYSIDYFFSRRLTLHSVSGPPFRSP